ncbi:MAG: hypothetical protein EBY16_10235, partial [Gammaproteobacteria bacterium]|nr:hypothetical protein [Gammaproteobacteria bacterium]
MPSNNFFYRSQPAEGAPSDLTQFNGLLATFDRFEDQQFHNDLIDFTRALGYPAEYQGICRGYTMRWIEAVLTNQTAIFLARIKTILELQKLLYSSDSTTIDSLFSDAKIKIDEEIDIKAFLESLMLYQEPSLSTKILEQPLSQQNFKEISNIAYSQAMEEAGGFKLSDPLFYGNFDEENLRYFLEDLQNKIDRSGYQQPIPFLMSVILESGERHSVSIIYRPKNLWQFVDINRFPNIKAFELESLIRDLKKVSFSEINTFSIRSVLPMADETRFEWDSLSTKSRISPLSPDLPQLISLAAHNGDLEVIKELLDNKENPYQLTSDDAPNVLYTVASHGHIEVMQELLKRGANPNQYCRVNNNTPLFIASGIGYLNIVQALLRIEEINPNLPDTDNGKTPLFNAAENGHFDVVQALLRAEGINLNLPNDHFNITPLYIAAEKGHLEIVQALLSKDGINPNSLTSDEGITPLHIAAEKGHLKIVQALLERGANVNEARNNGTTPLYIAAENGHLGIVQALLK